MLFFYYLKNFFKKKIVPNIAFIFFLFSFQIIFAQQNPIPSSNTNDLLNNLEFSLLTANRGKFLYNSWGHTLLIIEDKANKNLATIDYGHFLVNMDFLLHQFDGMPTYYVGTGEWSHEKQYYQAENRTIYQQKLYLSSAQKQKLLAQIQYDMLPKHQLFTYHHFRQNCTTKVRDLIDIALDGFLFKKYSQQKSGKTFRDAGVREPSISPFIKIILHILLSWHTDKEMSIYEEMFLPERLMKSLDESRQELEKIYTKQTLSSVSIFLPPISLEENSRSKNSFRKSIGFIAITLFSVFISFFFSVFKNSDQRLAKIYFLLWSITSSLLGIFMLYLHFFAFQIEFHSNLNLLIFNPLNIFFYFFYRKVSQKQNEKLLEKIIILFISFPIVSVLIRLLSFVFLFNFLKQPTEYFSWYVLVFYSTMLFKKIEFSNSKQTL